MSSDDDDAGSLNMDHADSCAAYTWTIDDDGDLRARAAYRRPRPGGLRVEPAANRVSLLTLPYMGTPDERSTPSHRAPRLGHYAYHGE